MRSTKILTSVWVVSLLLGTALTQDTTANNVQVEEPMPNVKIIEINNANLTDPSQFQWLEDNLFNSEQHWQIIARSYEGEQPSTSQQDCPQGKDCTDCNCECVFDQACTGSESHYHTFGGETRLYTIDSNGRVTYEDQVICESGGAVCLNNYLGNQYKVVTYDGQDYQLYYDGSVYQDGNLLCASGGCQCLLNHIYDNYFQIYTYNYNGVELDYQIYQDGTVFDLQGNVVSTGGTSSLINYIETTVITTIQKVTYNIDGVDTTFTIVMDRVTQDPEGTVICETGGADCLHQWVEDQMYSLTQYSVGSTIYTFRVYPDGLVTNDDGTEVICATGGETCLLEYFSGYVETTYQSTQVSYNIDGEEISFLIFGDGRVETLVTETVICETGGQACLQEYVESLMYSIAQYTIEGTVYTFKIYPDGRVEDEFGVVVCEMGGESCLSSYINEFALTLQSTQMSYNINGVEYIYIIDYEGKVTAEDGTVICESGGQACLDTYVQSQMSQMVEYDIDGTSYSFEITYSGSVIASDGTVVCETGGQACLDIYIQELMISLQETHIIYNINGVDTLYIIDYQGRVTMEDGTVICESGGQTCLDAYVQTIVYSISEYNIAGTIYTFHIYQDGRVTDASGVVICETGGVDCLQIYVDELVYELSITRVEYDINGVITLFIIDANGQVTDANGNIICATGGQVCLTEYVSTLIYSVAEFTIDGTVYIFHIYQSGAVYDIDGVLICETGGEVCLQQHVETLIQISQETIVTYTINNELMTFTIRYDGSVIDTQGNIICESGGQPCLEAWVEAQIVSYQVLTVDVYGEMMKFYLYDDGKVEDAATNEVVCASGGTTCLREYLDSLMPVISRVVYDINGIEYVFYVDQGTGLVWDTSNNVICETGGVPCLELHVEDITFSMDTINGITYRIYQNGTVFSKDGLTMICETGGQDCVLAQLGLALGQEVAKTESTGKYSVWGALSVAMIFGGVYLYQKRQSKQQDLFLENNIRQSLLQ